MDIQTSQITNNLHSNLGVGGESNNTHNRNLYDQSALNQQSSSQLHHQHPPPLQPLQPQPNHNQQITRPPNEQPEHTTENISQDNPIPIRNIKVDPETLPLPGQDQEHHIPQRDGNFQPEIDLGNVIPPHSCSGENTDANNFSSFQKDVPSTLNLKNESIGDFNAFHEQIQTVDPVLLWSMVRSRVVPQVSKRISKHVIALLRKLVKI